jgi:arylsulfatase A-like enzyme
MGLVLGLISGLVEGLVHMGLHRLSVLDNSWYPIIWIAAVFNAVIVGGVAAFMGGIVSRRPDSPSMRWLAVFTLFLLAIVPVLALMLKEWIYTYAIFLLAIGLATMLTRWQIGRATWALASGRALLGAVAVTVLAIAVIEGGSRIQERLATNRLPPADTSTPDVLLIIVDTLRADHLSSYGYGRPTSPAIDALAAQGVLFENSFATSSYTLPSHASILTGQYPRVHQIEWDTSHRPPPPTGQNLPEVLQSMGYRTGAFSANTFYFSREHGFGRGFLHFEDFFHSIEDMAWRTAYGAIATRLIRHRLGYEDLPGRKLASDVNDEAVRWIRKDSDRPFFATLNYMDAHEPYLPPQPYRNKFSAKPDPGGLLNSKWHIPKTLTPEQLQSEIDAYDGGIAYVDAQVSRLLSDLQAMARSRPLIVIVTSDHGEEFGEHGGFLHQKHLYREVIQVPLIVWSPGRMPRGLGIREGVRVKEPVSNGAIPATIMSMLGRDPSPFQIPSLKPLWARALATDLVHVDVPPVLSELKHRPWAFPHDAPIRFGSMQSLVDEGWHYIETKGRGPELFDWRADPRERTNVVQRPDAQAVVGRMQRLTQPR